MRTEVRRTYNCGFALSEQELRRIHDLLIQQFGRLQPPTESRTSYDIKFKNGSLSKTSAMEELLSQENLGPTAIVRLKVTVSDQAEKPSTSAAITFTNADEDSDSSANSVTYQIESDDRDWVFVTSSQLEERIARVKRFAPNQLFSTKRVSLMTALLYGLLPILFLFVPRVFPALDPSHTREKSAALNALASEYHAGRIKDFGELLLRWEHEKLDRESDTW